ncbi:MAG: glycoside hydrolase family 2, partial [Vallitaleaceae bacterium]|nr:glycoside hydrolase family 2 [Vallitaleaceae bacterium]
MSKELICLNGEWEFMPVYGVKACVDLPKEIHFEQEKIRVPSSWRYVTPEGAAYCNGDFGIVDDFQPFNLFEYPIEWSKADTGVYRKTFTIPDIICGERIFLCFNGIMQQSRIYLNNNIVAEWDEAFLPLKIDITKHIKAERCENELMVICTTFDEVQMKSGRTKSLGLIGSWFGFLGRGIWQDVYIERTSPTYIVDALIKTSVRNKSIQVEVEVENKQDQAQEVTIIMDILEKSEIVPTFKPQQLKLEGNSIKSIKIEEPWEDPQLWSFEAPFLYRMQIVLHSNGSEIDRKTISFGYREIWTENDQFILNGIRVNLRGDSWHFQGANQQTKEYASNWFKMCKEKGLNFVRLHAEPHPEYYLEAADEVGILIIDET